MRDQKRLYTGPAYARRLDRLIRRTATTIYTDARVLGINPEGTGKPHTLTVLSPKGLRSYESHAILLTTGCFEISRPARRISGSRPAGIFTTGTLQQLVNLRHLKPGKRALIIGSEHVSLSSVHTLRRTGISIAGMVEEDPELKTYTYPAKAMSRLFNFQIFKNTAVKRIHGNKRVEGVELVSKKNEKTWELECDTVIITGKFRPDSALMDETTIEQDPSTLGPLVDMDLMTSVPNIFAAGNLLRGADMHDLCALEGKLVAHSILESLKSNGVGKDHLVAIGAESPIRFVVPQKILPNRIRKHIFAKLFPWPAMQVEHTLRNPVIEAWSDNHRIWKDSYSKLIANTRIPLPVEKFEWNRVDPKEGVTLRVKSPFSTD
jgi:pyruvate/2-oxoglutarate dehydrogenase complex dihydrolipoamide dehydrogenase (E3) component